MFKFRYNQSGFSLVEVIIALGIFAILAAGIFNIATNSYRNFYGTGDKQMVTEYAQEGIEAVRSIRDNSWEALEDVTDGSSQGLAKNGSGYWVFSGSEDTWGDLTRQVQIYSVQRNSSGNIVASGGTNDISTRKAVVTISGDDIGDYSLTTYLTDWAYKTWEQTNWNGVGSRHYWAEDNMASSSYSSTTTSTAGQISIKYNALLGYGYGYLYSSIYPLGQDERNLKSIIVEQGAIPGGCSVQVTLAASTSNFTPAYTESQVYNITSTYYVSSTPDKLDNKAYLRYFLEMDCGGGATSVAVKSIKVRYR